MFEKGKTCPNFWTNKTIFSHSDTVLTSLYPKVMAKVKVLFIRNLTMETSQDEILATFEAVSDGQVERVKKAKDYAFVHFKTREAAEKAFEATKDKLILDDCHVEVTWSKPIDRQAHNERKNLAKAIVYGNGNRGQLMELRTPNQLPALFSNQMFQPQPLLPASMATQMNQRFSANNPLMPQISMSRFQNAMESIQGETGTGNLLPIDPETKRPTSNGMNNNSNLPDNLSDMILKNQQQVRIFC